MRKRLFSLCLTGGLLLGACGCTVSPAGGESAAPSPAAGIQAPAPSPSAAVESPVPEPVPTPFTVQTADVPEGSYAPWQEGYADFLSQMRQGEGELKNWIDTTPEEEVAADTDRWYSYDHTSEEYSLYDVDKDGTPELFLKYGDCEAAYYTVCYTFRNGRVTEVGDFGSGNSALCSWPGENAVGLYFGHMGIASMEKYAMEYGALIDQGEVFYEEIVNTDRSEYTQPHEIIPGSDYLPVYMTPTHWRPSDSPALLLPIYDYGAPPRQHAAPAEEVQVRSAIGKALWEGGELYGVSGDGFYGDTGLTSLDAYLRAGGAYPYAQTPLTATEYAWADVNGDGQTDCLLRLESKPDEYGNIGRYFVVLSLEENTVYAYFFAYTGDAAVTSSGSVYFGSAYQVSFYRNQCYRYPSSLSAEADGLVWDAFSQKP